MHGMQCMHVDFLLSGFVSGENKGVVIQIPKLDVVGSSPIARSTFCSVLLTISFLKS